MVVYEWIERLMGQKIAPDSNYRPPDDRNSQWYDIMAPDPNFGSVTTSNASQNARNATRTSSGDSAAAAPRRTGPPPPPPHAFSTPSPQPSSLVECQHCHHMTPSTHAVIQFPSSSSAASKASTTSQQLLLSPVQQRVLEASQDVAHAMSSPQATDVDKFFRRLNGVYSDKQHGAVIKTLQQRPDFVMVRNRTSSGRLAVGDTPLLAAARTGNVPLAEFLLQFGPSAEQQLQVTSLDGNTASHIAAELGHVELLELFSRYSSTHLKTLNHLNDTPLGYALKSPLQKANVSQYRTLLLEQQDPCLHGIVTHPRDRSLVGASRTAMMGWAEKPGWRVTMEDATLVDVRSTYTLVGVLDGHADWGQCSHFCADSIRNGIKSKVTEKDNDDWNQILLQVFAETELALKRQPFSGGTTANVAVLLDNNKKLVVANLGDSRCLVIRVPPQHQQSLEEQVALLSLAERNANTNKNSDDTAVVVEALSWDHKPNLPGERERIEKAGLKVMTQTFEGKEIAKVKKTTDLEGNTELGMSRSLGDFNFKDNQDLEVDQQAVIAVPDIQVRDLDESHVLFMVACDGIFDVLSNQEAGEFVYKKVHELLEAGREYVLPEAADALVNHCFEIGSEDNMSVVLVSLGSLTEKISADRVPRKIEFDDEVLTSDL